MRARLVTLVGVSLWCGAMSAQSQAPPIDIVMDRAADYAAKFVDRFANVVTEERYAQEVERAVVQMGRSLSWQPTQSRKLRSDLAIVKFEGLSLDWMSFRDVFEVDGAPVRDRVDRLTQLFSQETTTAWAQAARIAQESARYNIGPGLRTTNSPVLAILLLQRSVQSRFTFTLDRRDGSARSRVWVVNFRESGRPTVVQGTNGVDRPSSGRFWIDVDTGRVERSEMQVAFDGATWMLTTMFKPDERYGVLVPAEMRERYDVDAVRLVGVATYGSFRSFSVTTDVAVEGDKQNKPLK